MFVCLSAGRSPRYREDILRALAMPMGCSLQFRYDQKWVAQIIRDRLPAGIAKGQKVLIAYIDQEDKSKIPEIVPCRFATLGEVVPHGSTVSLELIVGQYAYAADLGTFDREMSSASANTLPRYQSDGSIKGAYWLELDRDLTTVSSTLSLADWERIVSQLAPHHQFEGEKCFYAVTGPHELGKKESVEIKEGIYALRSDKEYEIQVYHFHPNKTPSGVTLSIRVPTSLATIVSGASLVVDSRYDLKRTRFTTARLANAERGNITVTRTEASTTEARSVDFDMLIEVAGTLWATLLQGAIAGMLLAAPQVVAALQNPNIPTPNRQTIMIAAGVFGLLTGVFAAFALKKPV